LKRVRHPPITLKQLKLELLPFRQRSLGTALAHVIVAWLIYAIALCGAVSPLSFPVRLLASLVAGLFAGNLFMIGHDACHGSYTGVRRLDRILGRVAFLPTYHPFSLWALSHNRIHHGYTNLKGKDFVWTPLSKPEYDALPGWRRTLHRLYRTPLGIALYYPIEIWLPRHAFPQRQHLDKARAIYLVDRLLVLAFALAQIVLIMAVGGRTLGDWVLAIILGWVTPTLVFGWLVGFVIFFNHTHPRAPWFDAPDEWSAFRGTILGTVGLRFPGWTRFFASNIMDHVAHHADMRIPLVRLAEAQARIEELLPDQVIVQEWSISALLEILRQCKLYDYAAHRWLDFEGRPTTECNYAAKLAGRIRARP
jgi:omega-6 fatty acid desaturase (delta-12 desaturase)